MQSCSNGNFFSLLEDGYYATLAVSKLYSSDLQPVCRDTLLSCEGSAGVPREFGGRSKRSEEKKLGIKKLPKSMISIIFKK
jgi:hypothetical protein